MQKKWIAGFLSAAVLTCGMTMITAGAVDTASTAVRTVVVKTQGDDTGGYLEIGLQVDGGTKVSSIAATLNYDASKLTPYAWEGDAAVDMAGKTSWDAAAALPTKAPDNLSGKASVAYTDGAAGHLMLSAEAIQPVTLSQAAPGATMTAPVAQVVTVRMKYTGAFAAAAASIGYDTAATGSPAGGTVVVSDGASSTSYIGGQTATVTSGKTVAGTSGAAGDGEFVSIVFYDWDDTQLGSIAVQKGQDATEAVKKFAEDATVAAKLAANAQTGYTFDNKWVAYGEAWPFYGYYYNSSNKLASIPEPTADTGLAIFNNMQASMSVQVAYNATGVTQNSDVSQLKHTVSYVEAERLDVAGNYALTFEVERGNNHALVSPEIRVDQTTTAGTVSTSVKYTDKNSDRAVAVVGPSTTSATATAIDGEGVSVFTKAGNKSNNCEISAETYIKPATLAFINTALEQGTPNIYSTKTLYEDLGFVFDGTVTASATRLRNAVKDLRNVTVSSLSDAFLAANLITTRIDSL